MPPTRIKESCLPCRQRRSRCDGQMPCAPCNVHGTGIECNYASGRTNGAARRSASPPRVSASTASPASVAEVYQLRSSVASLESRIEQLERQLGTKPAQSPRISAEDQERWQRFKARLPPLGTCEILLDYVTVECDWLWWPGDMTSMWREATETQACTPPQAGLMAMSMAYSALLLSASSIYRVSVSPTLHVEMFELSKEYAVGEGVMEVDLLAAMVMYIIYSGRIEEAKPYVDRALAMALKLDLMDESMPSWRGLEWEELEERRRVAWAVIVECRWSHLGMPTNPFAGVRLNVCQPQWIPPQTDVVHLTDDANPVRIFRVKSRAEITRTQVVKTITVDYTSVFARLQTYLHSPNPSPSECESIYREIVHFRDVKLPAAGFADPGSDIVDFSDPMATREAAQRIIMYHSFGHLLFVTLRHWLTDTSNDPLVQTLREASVDGAMRTMATVPLVRSFATSKQGPFITPFAASNLFSAAMIFAVPILRAVKSAELELDVLHDWPTVKKTFDTTKTPLPPSAFTDPTIRYCANNILLLLDALMELKTNPLGVIVEERLSVLIEKYGLRQSQVYDIPQPPPMPTPSIEWMNPFPWPSGEPDQDVLQQLLQMDTEIWQAWLGGSE